MIVRAWSLLAFALAAPLVLLGAAGTARAQTFPPHERWDALPCGDGPMVDRRRDRPGAIDERDIVGDVLAPAGMRASDERFAYLRLRLDHDPSPGKDLRPYAWAFAIDLDGDRRTYEILVRASGLTDTVDVYRNGTTTVFDDPTDPVDEPAVASFPYETHARTVVAPGSHYGGDDDWFLDVAIPWSVLEPLGVLRTTPIGVWAVTSSDGKSLDADLACHDSGAWRLSDVGAPRTTLDPSVDTDGDGWPDGHEFGEGTDPRDPGSRPTGSPPRLGSFPVLEGAGGCATSRAPTGGDIAAFVVVAAVLARRRRSDGRD